MTSPSPALKGELIVLDFFPPGTRHDTDQQGSDSNTDYSGSTMIATSITPIAQRHRLIHQRSTPASLGSKTPAKFQQPRFSQEEAARQGKPQLTRGVGIGAYVDHLTGDRRLDTGTRESSTGESSTSMFTSLFQSPLTNYVHTFSRLQINQLLLSPFI